MYLPIIIVIITSDTFDGVLDFVTDRDSCSLEQSLINSMSITTSASTSYMYVAKLSSTMVIIIMYQLCRVT